MASQKAKLIFVAVTLLSAEWNQLIREMEEWKNFGVSLVQH